MIFFRSSIFLKTLAALLLSFFLFSNTSSYAQENKSLIRRSIKVVLDEQNIEGINVYKASSNEAYFFSLRDIAKIYNATFEWKPISSIVTMRVNNKRMDFTPDDRTVLFGKDPKTMLNSSRLVSNNVYIPAEVLLTDDFTETTGIKARWNASKNVLNLSYLPNIHSIEYFTNVNDTKVVVGLNQSLQYTLSKTADAIILRIMRGKVESKIIPADNGAIKNIVSENNGKSAKITINLAQKPASIKAVQSPTLPGSISITLEHSAPLPAEAVVNDANNSANIISIKPEPEAIAPIESGINNSDLDNVPVERFDIETIKDESMSIVDDLSSFRDIAVAITGRKSKDAKVIVIDAGHGGNDPGAIGPNGLKEKDIALEIAYELKRLFDKDKNYNVILTRKDDIFIPLAERTNIANEKRANLFISIHCNANINRKVSGFEVYFLSERASDASAFATANLENSVIELEGKPTPKLAGIQKMLWSMMQNEYLNESSELSSFISAIAPGRMRITNRGVKQAGFYVLRGAQMPAVLVEVAFISNYEEEMKLRNGNFQKAAALSIYEGVLRYYERKSKQNGKK
jgi:N-acetylmuramoyl-L-alanine amidase